MDWTDEQLLEEFTRDVAAKVKDKSLITTRFDIEQCWAIAMNLQLALKHPGNMGNLADKAREVAVAMFGVIATTPAEKEMVRRGWGEDEPSSLPMQCACDANERQHGGSYTCSSCSAERKARKATMQEKVPQ